MKLIIGSDERSHLTDFLIEELQKRGHEVHPIGTLNPDGSPEEHAQQWAEVGKRVGEGVAKGIYQQGIACCWTGTGVSIAANKVPGVRAALCTDPATAEGARKWNDANVLALSLRLVSEQIAKEILEAWFSATFEESERHNVAALES
ncbi:RpiB/LacA/LacB family sugar-phosphate isomerase [Candidatus Chlorohelix sp.]|uniref:RpiB/LacA/LacB family sugar-phosphate isomerase n=1 Tax=Candidatus Chlorohelix sp. TaxID=3139201 RepID=UPI0030439FE8